jgi:ProP effector
MKNSKDQRAKADANIVLLEKLWPKCFAVYEKRRQPLKIGIRDDIVAQLQKNGRKVNADALAITLRRYVNNYAYLRKVKTGAGRIDLNGKAAGTVTAEQAADAARRLAGRKTTKPSPPENDEGDEGE